MGIVRKIANQNDSDLLTRLKQKDARRADKAIEAYKKRLLEKIKLQKTPQS